MSDEKMVEKELLAGATYLNGTDYYRGDKITLTESQAAALEEQGLVGEVGTMDKLREEHAKAQQDAREREAEEAQRREDEARQRGEDAQRHLRLAVAESGPSNTGDDTSRAARDNAPGTPDPTSGAGFGGGDRRREARNADIRSGSPKVTEASSSQDGPKVTRNDTTRSPRRA